MLQTAISVKIGGRAPAARVTDGDQSTGEGGTVMDTDEKLLERYRAYRGQIEAESALVGVRLGWLIGSEAFLAAAYATVLTVPTAPAAPRFVDQAKELYFAIPIAGITLAFVVGISLWAALRAMGKLRKEYAGFNDHPGYLPAGTIRKTIYYGGSTAPFLVPPLVISAWIYILLVGSPT
jgi:hypothetical protein